MMRQVRATVLSGALAGALAAGAAPVAADDAPEFIVGASSAPLSKAARVGNVLYLSGELGIAEDGSDVVAGGITAETRRMMERIGATLASAGRSFDDVFKCTVFLADIDEWDEFNAVYKTYFQPGRYPARSVVEVSELVFDAAVEMECMAHHPG